MGFLLIKEEKDVSNIYCKIQDHTVKIFFSKQYFFNIAGLHQPPHPLTLTAYPTPGKVVPQPFFIKITAKDVKKITYMP